MNKDNEEMVTITKLEYERLLKAERWLEFNAVGIDNWGGIERVWEVEEKGDVKDE